MNCLEARSLAIEKLTTSMPLETERRLNGHLNHCDRCEILSFVLYCVDEFIGSDNYQPERLEHNSDGEDPVSDPSPLEPRDFEAKPISPALVESIGMQKVLPIERIFLLTPRAKLRQIVDHMQELSSEAESHRLDACLTAFRAHIKWADDLADRGGMPNDRVYPPDGNDA